MIDIQEQIAALRDEEMAGEVISYLLRSSVPWVAELLDRATSEEVWAVVYVYVAGVAAERAGATPAKAALAAEGLISSHRKVTGG